MYTDEDLKSAIKEGVFSAESVKQFRIIMSGQKNLPSVDEENFRLVASFNDIFVVIACLLLLLSSFCVVDAITSYESIGFIGFTVLSWLLAEFFVRKRKMVLPAIVLLLSYIGGLSYTIVSLFSQESEIVYISAPAILAVAAYFHWVRFKVPITVAAGTAAAIGFMVSIILNLFPNANDWPMVIMFLCGLCAFFIAMCWDSADTARITFRSDVAFWLHLLAAPLIIHPIFSRLGVLHGNESFFSIAIVIFLYVVMMLISIIIDRRAFMISSLVYVLYAITSLIKTYGDVGYSFALTGVFMGSMLLLLSAFWHRVRSYFVRNLTGSIRLYIPKSEF